MDNTGLNHRQLVKYENQRKVLSLISKTPIPRIDIAGQLSLTQAAVSSIVDNLISIGIVHSTGTMVERASAGRRPELLEITSDWGYVLGISIDRDGIDIGLVDLCGNILDSFPRFPVQEDYAPSLDTIAEKVHELLARNPIPAQRILGVGVAVPGPFDTTNGQMLNPPQFFKKWHYLELQKELSARLPYQVLIEHNSIAMAKAERCLGIGTNFSNFVIYNINAGLGAGLVLNNIVHSRYGYGGEVGHTSIDFNGRLCSCGNRGCLETYASISAILHEVSRIRPEITSWQYLVDLAYEGDVLCNQFIQLESEYIGRSIVNLNNLCGLDAALLTGQIAYHPERLLENIRSLVSSSSITTSYRPLVIDVSGIQGNRYIVSSASLLIDRIYNEPNFFYSLQQSQSSI